MKPGDFYNISVSTILRFVKGAAECTNKTAAQKIDNGQSAQVTTMSALMCTIFHAGQFIHYCSEVKGTSLYRFPTY
jgi:hypothetical protein